MLKLLFRTPLLLVLLIAIGYAVYNPAIIPNDSWRASVIRAKEQVMSKNPEASSQVLGAMTQAKDAVVGWAQTAKVPAAFSGQKQEIVVDEYVKGLSDQVKQLPAEQLHRVKQQFCQDIVNEATQSNTVN